MRAPRLRRQGPSASSRGVPHPIAGFTLLAAFGLFGCAPVGGLLKQYATPRAVDLIPEQAYPLEVTYEMLGQAKAEACGVPRSGEDAVIRVGAGESMLGNPALFQEAKYLAIESVPNADNLLYIRAKVERQAQKECVTVTGRAYRVLKLQARAPGAAPEEAPPPGQPEAAPAGAEPPPPPAAAGAPAGEPQGK